MKSVEIRAVRGRADLDRFIKLPYRIYRDDPNWVAPLLFDVRRLLDRAKHPFHQHADVEYFIAVRGDDVVGRIAAIVNHAHNEFYGDRLGFFGLFECVDDVEVARALFGAAEAWLRERGMDTVRGPMNLSTNEELSSPGILIDGFDTPPSVMMTHSPPFYSRLLEAAGYEKSQDLLAYWVDGRNKPEHLVKGLERLKGRQNVTIRTLDKKRLKEEVQRIKDIYNSAWERNWGFVPLTEAELDHMAKSLAPVVDPRLCAFAEVDGEPVGFLLELPDFNRALKPLKGRLFPFGLFRFLWNKRKIHVSRVITLGVRPEYRQRGIDAMLIMHTLTVGVDAGYVEGECSWILESNWQMRRGLERVGGRVYKTYRVYDKPLAG